MTQAASRPAAAPAVDIRIESPLWQGQPQAEDTIRAAIVQAASFADVDGEVSVLLTDDDAIARLNRDWRNLDKPTNVLSFPAPETGAGELIGDIVLAYETLARECETEDGLFLHHLAHLAAHGFLHLIGYDHQTDSQADEMEGLESQIMLRLHMPDPYRAHERDP